MRRAITLACTTAALVVGGTTTATAAPPERDAIPLVCDDGNTYEVVVNGNGAFTPGNLLASTRVIVPIAFGEVAFVAVTPSGDVVENIQPPSEKGGGNVAEHNPQSTVTCSFTFTDTLTEEQDGLPADTEITISGEVTGFLTGPR
jgi:hypothetical protein